MATVKLVLDTRRKKANNKYPLLLRITHNRRTCSIQTGYDLDIKNWSLKNNYINKRYANYQKLKKIVDRQLEEIEAVIMRLEVDTPNFDVTLLKQKLTSRSEKESFNSFTKRHIDNLHLGGKHGNAITYECALSSVKHHFGNRVFFEQITPSFLEKYEMLLLQKGLKTNSISVYMRCIRSLYNKAIKCGKADEKNYPFKSYKIKHESTAKRAIPIKSIAKLFQLNLDGSSSELARDIFMFSFSLMGINFTDIALLTNENIKQGRLIYRRKKTHKIYDVKLTPIALEILNKYENPSTRYLLPVISNSECIGKELKLKINNKLKNTNKHLKKISDEYGIEGLNSTYVARHSFATTAKQLGYSNELIAEALGHGYGNTITNIYLESFDKEKIDEMNLRICLEIMKKEST